MGIMNVIAEFGEAFVPKKVRPHIHGYLMKAGITKEPYAFFGILFFICIGITSLIYMALNQYIFSLPIYLAFLLSFITFTGIALALIAVVILFIYAYLDVVIYQRTAQIEQILPDYLQLVSTNVKSGLAFDKSLWYAIKPRFGVLAQEMQIVLKKVMTGYDLASALDEFSKKYNSPMLRRSMNLIVGELEGGGKIGVILDDLVVNIKQNQKLKAEMAASVITYMIFIGAIVMVIAPALFALSYNLLSFMKSFMTTLAHAGASNSSLFTVDADKIDLPLFQFFSLSALIIVSLWSAIIVSVIEKGNIKGGLKYIPIFVIGTAFFYFIFRIVLQAVFGSITL